MLGTPNRPIHNLFEFICLRNLADIIYLKFQPVLVGRGSHPPGKFQNGGHLFSDLSLKTVGAPSEL